MYQTRSVELGTGLFVLLGFAALFFLTTQTVGSSSFLADEGFEITARFDNVGSLKDRAPVAMSGVTIGRVTSVVFDSDSLEAIVTFVIEPKYDRIPDDSDASILTAGLLGSQYIGIEAGGSDENLVDGSEIHFTQSAIIIEKLISKYLFSSGAKDDKD